MERNLEELDNGISDADIAENVADCEARWGPMRANPSLNALLALLGISLTVWMGAQSL